MTSPNIPRRDSPPVAHPAVISPELVPDRRGTVAFLSHVRREGDWILPRLFRAVAFMGNVELDLTRARVGPGTSQIELKAIMGSVEILVPPELRLECEGEPFVASFEVNREAPSATSPDAPLVRITGTAFLASVEVKVIDPNAPGWFEKLRARWLARGD
jgi:cell wall-active antibiotic response 4TMS protein YvqF